MKPFSYLLILLAPVLTILGMQLGGIWTYSTGMLAFGVIPLLELCLRPQTDNLDPAAETRALGDRRYDAVVYVAVPLQYAVIGTMLYVMSTAPLAGYELGGVIFSTGICCGALGINIAHELGHRKKGTERLMAKALLLTSLYMHCFIEHMKGHHAQVSTKADPASARYGETLYGFLLRSISLGYVSAWRIENKRLRTLGRSPWTTGNAMIRYHAIELAFVALIWFFFGTQATLTFLASAAVGIVLLEIVNYIEHYGLERQHNGARYEKVRPVHSWNSDHVLGRSFLFNLSRHSDHHANAARRYQILRRFEESPQMPTGYPGMMMLALLPPLWFSVLHPQIEKYREALEVHA